VSPEGGGLPEVIRTFSVVLVKTSRSWLFAFVAMSVFLASCFAGFVTRRAEKKGRPMWRRPQIVRLSARGKFRVSAFASLDDSRLSISMSVTRQRWLPKKGSPGNRVGFD
jgi:hypothetical protein